jgi:hypothetical protein
MRMMGTCADAGLKYPLSPVLQADRATERAGEASGSMGGLTEQDEVDAVLTELLESVAEEVAAESLAQVSAEGSTAPQSEEAPHVARRDGDEGGSSSESVCERERQGFATDDDAGVSVANPFADMSHMAHSEHSSSTHSLVVVDSDPRVHDPMTTKVRARRLP